MKPNANKKPSDLSVLDKIQAEAVEAVTDSLQSTKKALLQMPTGTGKTRTAFKIMSPYLNSAHPVLWLTHKTDLKLQTTSAGKKFFNGVPITEFHGTTRHFNSKLVVAMVPTLARDSGFKLLKKHLREGSFSLVVVDEAHHAAAAQFTRVLDVIAKRGIPILGLSATPTRPDGLPIDQWFGPASYVYTFEQARLAGTIATPIGKIILTNTKVRGIPDRNGNYRDISKSVDRKVVIEARNSIILKEYKKHSTAFAKERNLPIKAVCFCINKKHAERMSKIFPRAAYLVGDGVEMTSKQREETLEKFRNTNEIEVLCVVDLFNEGIDIPDINVGIMARPTYSNIVYVQQLGRLLRVTPKKKECLVLDFVDNIESGFGSYTIANVSKSSVSRSDISIEHVDSRDEIAIQRRIQGIFDRIDAYQDGRRNFYATKEEVYEVIRRQGWKTKTSYDLAFDTDSKLPGNPYMIYPGFSFREAWEKGPKYTQQVLLDYAKNKNVEKPNANSQLGRKLYSYTTVSKNTYDVQFTKRIKALRPDWFIPLKLQRSYKKLLKMIPKDVSFGKNQVWKGVWKKYKFISKKYGAFTTTPGSLMQKVGPWQNGRSGHPKEGRGYVLKGSIRAVRNKETKKIFSSASDAARALGQKAGAVSCAIKRGTKAGGVHWEYVDSKPKTKKRES